MKKNKKEKKPKVAQVEESAETLSEEITFEGVTTSLEADAPTEIEKSEALFATEASAEDAVEETSDETSDQELEAAMALEGLVAEESDAPSFLPEATDDMLADESSAGPEAELEGTELEAFESAEIEDVEFVEEERLDSIVESVMFASDRPVSLNQLKLVFKGTNIKSDKIRKALDRLPALSVATIVSR